MSEGEKEKPRSVATLIAPLGAIVAAKWGSTRQAWAAWVACIKKSPISMSSPVKGRWHAKRDGGVRFTKKDSA